MPRKSAAALSVTPLVPRPYPEPPAELTKRQAEIWRSIVRCRPVEWFDHGGQALLVQFCRHYDTADVLAAVINECDTEDHRYGRLLKLAARQSTMLAMLSAKLRLAPQHVRRVEHVVKARTGIPPWEHIA